MKSAMLHNFLILNPIYFFNFTFSQINCATRSFWISLLSCFEAWWLTHIFQTFFWGMKIWLHLNICVTTFFYFSISTGPSINSRALSKLFFINSNIHPRLYEHVWLTGPVDIRKISVLKCGFYFLTYISVNLTITL